MMSSNFSPSGTKKLKKMNFSHPSNDYILQTVYKRWEDIYTCRVHNAMINIPTTASLLSLLALAMDRFVFIKYGLYYPDILPIQQSWKKAQNVRMRTF